MKRFINLVFILVIMLILVISIAQFTGSLLRREPELLSILFNRIDGSPCQHSCLFGVMPGYTNKIEAFNILQQQPIFKQAALHSGQPSCDYILEEKLMSVNFYCGWPARTYISFGFNGPAEKDIRLGDLLIVLGKPDYMQWSKISGYPTSQNHFILLYYSSVNAQFSLKTQFASQLSLNDTLKSITVFPDSISFPEHGGAEFMPMLPYMGLKSLNAYVPPPPVLCCG